MKKKRSQTKLFIAVFVALAGWVVLQNLWREEVILFDVPDNAGVSVLETNKTSLVGVFQDGRVAVWDWDVMSPQGDSFKVVSDRVILPDAQHLAAINKEGRKNLTLYSLSDGKKQKEIAVGWADQAVRPLISPDKTIVALVRCNAADSKGSILCEFLTTDIEKELLGSPVSLSIQQKTEEFVDYAVDNSGTLYAVGSQNNLGRMVAINLANGKTTWDAVFENTKEFCACLTSPDGRVLYAGNLDGMLYKINADDGKIEKKIRLLKEGETRPVTNDYSVLNLAFSPDGQYYVATINPKAYILKTESDQIVHDFSPADRLVSKIAFSPDNKFVATSDIRAGYPIKIWPLPEEK